MIIQIDNKDTNRFSLIKGEIKNHKFTINDEHGDSQDVSSAILTFHAKETMGAAADLTVTDGAMDKTDAATGIVHIPIDTTGLDHSTLYYCELKIEYSANTVDHSGPLLMMLNQPIVE